MDLYIFIIGICVCALTTGVFLYFRVNKGGVSGIITKALASFCFIAFAVLLGVSKTSVAYGVNYAIALITLGLVCGLIGDILLDLKVVYPFHEDKYLNAGMVAFSCAHVFNILALILLAYKDVNLFSKEYILPLLLIVLGSIILCLVIFVLSKKVMKLDFGKHTILANVYCFILLLVTIFAIYLSFIGLTTKMFILAIGFALFLASDLVLSLQYFGGKQSNKKLIYINHLLYYMAQIIIAGFIFFI